MAVNNDLDDFLTSVAVAIRNRKRTTDKINAQNFVSEIKSIGYDVEATTNEDYTQDIIITSPNKAEPIINVVPDYIVSPAYTNIGESVSFKGNEYIVGTNAFATPQEAVNVIAEDGKTIYVGSGEYVFDSILTINYGITFLGANAGISGERTDRIEESSFIKSKDLSGGQPHILQLNAQNITFDGITFTNEYSGENTSYFINFLANAGNITVVNCRAFSDDMFNSFIKPTGNGGSGVIKICNNYFKNILQFIVWVKDGTGMTELDFQNNTIIDCAAVGANGLLSIRQTNQDYTCKIYNNKFIYNQQIYYKEVSTFYLVKVYGGIIDIKYNTFVISKYNLENIFTNGLILNSVGTDLLTYSNNYFFGVDNVIIPDEYKGINVCISEEERNSQYLIDTSISKKYEFAEISADRFVNEIKYNNKALDFYVKDVLQKKINKTTSVAGLLALQTQDVIDEYNSKLDFSKLNNLQYLYSYNSIDNPDLSWIDMNSIINLGHMFHNYQGSSLIFNNFDTSNVTSIYSMFEDCFSLQTIDLSNFNTSAVTSFSRVFKHCDNLTSLDLSNFIFNTHLGSEMFAYCYSLTSVNLPSSLYVIAPIMFMECQTLPNIDFSMCNISEIKDLAFQNCYNLQTIDLSGCQQVPSLSSINAFENVNINNDGNYQVIVPDELYDIWIYETNWVDIADHIVRKSEVVL